MHTNRIRACLPARLSALATTLLVTGVAAAQSVADPAAPPGALEEVVVTGSRIARNGYDTPTPVSVVGHEEIEAEAPGSIADVVISLPSVRGSTTASTSSGSLSNGAAGIAALNLRSLGVGRTLVLFDGQRSVVSASTGQVDTNTFPQPLIDRVEIVTGGASSAYGSDAIGGVVNFVLDKDFTGIKSSVEYGESSYGDDAGRKVEFTSGTPFADDRGHVLFSAEHYDTDGIHYTTRDWAEKGYFGIVNPDKSPGAPHYLVDYNIGISAYTPGGLIVSGPLKGTYFGQGGSVNQLDYGDVSGQWMRGGDWQYTTSGELGTNSLAADDQRDSVFLRSSFMLDGGTEVFGQISSAKYEGWSYYIRPTDRNITIQADNAFLPASVAADMTTLGLTSFTMSTSNADMPASGSNNMRETTRLVLGANGEIGDGWTWDAYYQKGRTSTDEHELPTFNFARLALATDAVFDGSGNIVCRSTLTDPANGCVPLDRFGVGVASQDALDYVLGRPERKQEFNQDVAAINFTPPKLDGWAGPIEFAVGAEWRQEEMSGSVEDQYTSGWKYGNYKVTEGKYDVAETYFETVVPLAKTLELNAAARYTDYSTSGGVTTWKTGLVYSPIDAVTLRVTQSHDIRAPNMSELYETGTARTNAVSINGASVPFIQNLQGNPKVLPEEADTLGVGVIFQPGFAPRFATSVDYYDIKIDGVIDFVAAQDVADFCFIYGVQRYCDNLNYVGGVLSTIDLYYENLNSMKARGVDLEASYSLQLDQGGDLSFRALATHYIDAITDDGVTAVNEAGSNLTNTPDWVYKLSALYSMKSFRFGLTARGVSDGVINTAYIECASNCPPSVAPNYTINDNSVSGETFFDAYVSKTFKMRSMDGELFLSVKNLMDADPVLVANPASQGSENRPAYLSTNRDLYDVLGRTYKLGMRFKF